MSNVAQFPQAVAPTEVLPGSSRVGVSQLREARLFALKVLRDPTYQINLLKAMQSRKVAPAVEIAIMHYGWGMPDRNLNINVTPGSSLEELTTEQLRARAEELAGKLLGMETAEALARAQVAAAKETDRALADADFEAAKRLRMQLAARAAENDTL